jgi:hypothetical protein
MSCIFIFPSEKERKVQIDRVWRASLASMVVIGQVYIRRFFPARLIKTSEKDQADQSPVEVSASNTAYASTQRLITQQ